MLQQTRSKCVYIYSETSVYRDREEYITQENDGKKIYKNLKSP